MKRAGSSPETDAAPDIRSTRVAVLTALFPPAFRGGGPIRTLDALVRGAPTRFEQFVLTRDRDLNCDERLEVDHNQWISQATASVYYASVERPLALFAAFLRLRQKKPQVLYLNSFFDPSLAILPQLLGCVRFWRGAQRMVAPRGEFGTGALGRRALKKGAFLAFYRLFRFHRGVVWHASSEMEAADIKRIWGRNARVLVAQDDTDLPFAATPAPSGQPDQDCFRLVFLGRLVEHKGIAILLRALRSLESPIVFDIYGPEEDDDYVAQCRLIAEDLPQNVRAHFRGEVAPDEVRSVLGAYDLFVLPTAGENFGHVVAESLSVSCPVMCTPYTPWGDVFQNGGGRVVRDREVESWAEALTEYAAVSAVERSHRRISAAHAYETWRAQADAAHIFELLEQEMA